ncbi:hypothetical protein B7463_g1604, partial [Scytalidium lignicola]
MDTPTRRAYHGSCHCGLTRYIAYITLPPPIISAEPGLPTTRIYKCNCTICQKASIFHLRLISSPDDFLLLSPISKDGSKGGIKTNEGGLKSYTCFAKKTHFYFCSRCGVRCFSIAGEGELKSVPAEVIPPVPQNYLHGPLAPQDVEINEGKVKVWSPQKEGWLEEIRPHYLSVNAATPEPGQDGLDLKEWSEKGWISYLNCLKDVREQRLEDPYEGGMY